jgi:hypothetical protein
MEAQTARVVKQAEEALREAAQEPDPAKKKPLLEKAVTQLVALGRPPQDVLQKVRDALQALDAATAKNSRQEWWQKELQD